MSSPTRCTPASSPSSGKVSVSVRSHAHTALEDLRTVIGVLRDDRDDAPQGLAPLPTVADLDDLVGECRAGGMDLEVDIAVAPSAVPPPTGLVVYRVVQEALTNARKHAPGRPVQVHVSATPPGAVTVVVTNGLPGRSPADAARGDRPALPGAGAGLLGLAERVELAGGSLTRTAVDGLHRLEARIPWRT